MSEVTVELDCEQVEEIMRKELFAVIQHVHEEAIKYIEQEEELNSWQQEDLQMYIKMLRASKVVYKWYAIDTSVLKDYEI
jgi:hypothetical protein